MYSQAEVNWLLKRAYMAGWMAGERDAAVWGDWFTPSPERSWKESKVREWCLKKAKPNA
jgi:hypothetical protein